LGNATRSVKMIVHLRKRSHNRILPAGLCTKCRCSPKQRLVGWLI